MFLTLLLIRLYTAAMAETLGELLRQLGIPQANCGITQVGASYINRGHRSARADTIERIAAAIGQPVEVVAEACAESWRRAHPTPPATVGPVTDGHVATDHATQPIEAGGA